MPNDCVDSYFTALIDGTTPACEKMKRLADRILTAKAKPDRFHYDKAKAERPIEFIERFCCVPSGSIGSPMVLQSFQKAWLNTAFGFVDEDGLRQYREVFCDVARKNGKSSLMSAIMLYMLIADGEGSPQVVSAATKAEQARLTYEAAYKMILQSPALQKRLKKRQTDIYYPANMGKIKPLSSNAHSLDGLDIHFAVLDELAAWRSRDVFDLIRQAVSARKQPLVWSITTNNFVRDGIFDNLYQYGSNILSGTVQDERFLPLIYELDDNSEWTDPNAWMKANPALGSIKSREYLSEMVERAQSDSSIYPTVMVKEFDMKQTGSTAWLRWSDFDYEEAGEDFDPRDFDYYIGGFDAADTIDLNAAKALFIKKGSPKIYVKSMYWLPEEQVELNSGTQQERESMPYRAWVRRGLLRTVPDKRVSRSVFLDWFVELKERFGVVPLKIGFDPWHVTEDNVRDFRAAFGKNCMIPVRQGAKTLSEPMKDLKVEFQSHNIIYGGNPIDKYCFANVEAKADINANIQPVKGLSKQARIDGFMSLLIAYTVMRDNKNEFELWSK